ncbi:GDSL esterase/lipase 6 [Morella rubra]|uniref:GDSL esterase/lipase 6 n=1 Tax=Morella rubra TaxID=262757 RepID=A0A6A1UZY8_9ROSI|nr:GDSL esterase/lipase 6 [Morella rubra]
MVKFILTLILLSTLQVLAFSAENIGIFTFGDSIFDAGNNHFNQKIGAQADFPPYGSSYFPYPTGRFTNGRTVVDFICEYLGIDFQQPYLEAYLTVANGTLHSYPSNGINFASAGSGVLSETNKFEGAMSLELQLRQFRSLVLEGQIDRDLIRNSLFFLEAGSNDIFNYFMTNSSQTPKAYVQTMLYEMQSIVDDLYLLGARRIALFSLGPVGCVPARAMLSETTPQRTCFEPMNVMAKRYNHGLHKLVESKNRRYPGAVLTYGDVFNIVHHIRLHPEKYGFFDVNDACCGSGILRGELQCGRGSIYQVCDNPDEFMFWDFFHPTEHTYRILASELWSGSSARIRPVNLKFLATHLKRA